MGYTIFRLVLISVLTFSENCATVLNKVVIFSLVNVPEGNSLLLGYPCHSNS